MDPMTDSGATRRRLVERLAIGVLIGVVAISVGGAALLAVYLNRIGDAADGLERAEALGAYPGRPEPVVVDGMNAVNYLLMARDSTGELEAVLIAHLSASRRDLTLVALPVDLLPGTSQTLAASYAVDPLRTARDVEQLTGARMDHQVHLGLDGFAGVVDILGGVDLGGGRLDGYQVRERIDAAPDDLTRSAWTADLLRATLARASMGVAITDPNRFDKVMDTLTPCLTVDAGLTGDEVRLTMVESRVKASEVLTWPLATVPGSIGEVADQVALARLRAALATDTFPPDGGPAVLPATATSTPHTSVAGSTTPMGPASTVPASTSAPAPGGTSSPGVGTSPTSVVDGRPTATSTAGR